MRLGRGIVALCALVVAATTTAALLIDGAVTVELLLALALALVAIGVGALLSARLPRHAAGPLIAAAGAIAALTLIPGDVSGTPFAGDWMLLYTPFAMLLLVMPEGAPRGRLRRALAVGLPLVALAFLVAAGWAALTPGPAPAATVAGLALIAAFALGLLASIASLAVRYRGAEEHVRLQLRWVLLAGLSLPATLLLCWASILLLGGPDLVVVGLALMYLSLPLATAAALLAPARFDVDRLLVAVTTVATLATAVLLALTAGTLLARALPVELPPPFAVVGAAAATLGAVAAYGAVRRLVGRMLYRERERAATAIRTLRRAVDAGAAAPESVQDALRAALRDPGLRVEYRRISGGTIGVDGSAGRPDAGPATPLVVRGEEIGALVASPGRAKAPPAETARLAAPLVEAVRMRAELADALREVGASRERLLRAGYEERRRLERDLHDGAQQRLVALGMTLRVLQRARPRDAALAAELDAAVAEVALAVAELRRLAHGVRPSTLDDGLAPALADLVQRSPVPVQLDIDEAELSDAVTTTAYFVASEAIVNAIRHAGADSIRVHLARDAGRVRLRIVDDGCGGARARSGLAGLSDRVEALGGRLRVDSPAGVGTTVEAVIPCAS